MNKTTTLSLLGGVVFAGSAMAGEVCVTPAATDNGFSSYIAAGYHSDYVDRGVKIGEDTITTEIATAFTCPYTGLDLQAGVSYYSQHDFLDAGVNVDELRFQFGASKDLGFATGYAGYVQYHYNDPFGFDASDDQEIYVGLSKELYGFDTSLTYFWGLKGPFRGNNEGYLEGRVKKDVTIYGQTISTDVALGYLVEEGALSHLTTKLTYNYKLAESATLSPYVAYSVELDDLEQSFGGFQPLSQENEFFAGASLTVTF